MTGTRCANMEPHERHHLEVRAPPPGYRGSWKGKEFCSWAYPTATTSECHRRSHFCEGVPSPSEEKPSP
jgi:hypothetical protein